LIPHIIVQALLLSNILWVGMVNTVTLGQTAYAGMQRQRQADYGEAGRFRQSPCRKGHTGGTEAVVGRLIDRQARSQACRGRCWQA
jgi:hypothetical protein